MTGSSPENSPTCVNELTRLTDLHGILLSLDPDFPSLPLAVSMAISCECLCLAYPPVIIKSNPFWNVQRDP